MVNHVKSFLVTEFGKYFIFKLSLLVISCALVWYLAACSIVDSFISSANLVNLRAFHPRVSYFCRTYFDIGDTKLGLLRTMLRIFWARICSTTFAILFCLPKLFCWTFLSSWPTSCFYSPLLAWVVLAYVLLILSMYEKFCGSKSHLLLP